ncbi:thiol:disulfide interchange protein DsbA/DsbL [Rhodanobacter sp. L36]|uniref:thiol:disulfide interchange protein DsbA/DsbL n=1 Tax=Rhodanobacter sp. L36 TaxID=1747221 RepID=UPI00131AD25C|nr:thiol:disulfide interchange protein DsbA/DsbL [Rhodanobacter sp. L36]
MFKRLPILCAALLALAACSHDNNSAATPAPTPAAATSAATPLTKAPPAAPTTTAAPAAAASAPAAASTTASTDASPSNGPALPAFVDNGKWVEGKDYTVIEPAQPKLTGTDKIEVIEAFSYGCPACNAYHPTMNEMVKELPSNVVVAFLPASFMPQENWVTLQRAYITAQALGVAEKGNDAMYDAVWNTRELSSENSNGSGLKPKDALPTIDDIAKVYAKVGVDPKEFAAVANSFAINTKMKRADDLMKDYGVQGTPTLIIDGKYRVEPLKFKDLSQSIELVKWLASKEAAGK